MDQKPKTGGPKSPYPESEGPKGPKRPFKERWANYEPNKKSLYKTVAYSVFLTVALGFTLGGWYTRGGTQDLVREARLEYAAKVCAEKFMAADVTGQNLADLKEQAGQYQRRHTLEEGNWVLVTKGDSEAFVEEASLRCGERLVSGTQPSTAG